MLSVLVTKNNNDDENNNSKGGGKKLWKVINIFMALMVVMVSQVYIIPKLIKLYTLNV